MIASLDARRIITPEDHACALHGGRRGKVIIAEVVDETWREHTVAINDLSYIVQQRAGLPDIYLSQNRFFGRRAVARLCEIGALFADLDYYRTRFADWKPDFLLSVALRVLSDTGIPAPTFTVSTGRGLALVWLHSPIPRRALPRWRLCQRRIFETLKEYGADPMATDAARVLRLVGTENGKAKAPVVALTDVGHVWVFDDLADEVLPLSRAEVRSIAAERARRRAARKLDTAPPRNFTAATLWEGRLTDLQALLQYRFMGTLPPGRRNVWMLVAGIAMSHLVPAQCLPRELAALAREVASWDEREARARLSSVMARAARAAHGEKIEYRGHLVDPRYRLCDTTIIDMLAITEEEMLGAGLHHLVSPEIKRDRERDRGERRRRVAGAVARQTYLDGAAARQAQAAEMHARGMKWREIGTAMGISPDAARMLAARHDPDRTGPSGCMVAKPASVGQERETVIPERIVTPVPRSILPASGGSARRPQGAARGRQAEQLSLPGIDGGPVVDLDGLDFTGGKAPPRLGQVVRAYQRLHGLRQRDIAQHSGISRPQLTNILRGRSGMSREPAERLMAFLRQA